MVWILISPKSSSEHWRKNFKSNLLEILRLLVFLFNVGKKSCVFLHAEREKPTLILKQPAVTPSTLSKVTYKWQNLWDSCSPRFSLLEKGVFWERQLRRFQAAFVSFHSTNKWRWCQRATSSLLLLGPGGWSGARLSLRNEIHREMDGRLGSKVKLIKRKCKNGPRDFGKSDRVSLWPAARISSHFCRQAYVILHSKRLKTYSYVWILFIKTISLIAMELFIWGIHA